jgi:hypothetical protein
LAPLATKWLFAASKADPLGSTNPEANVLRTPLGVNLYKNVLTADLKTIFIKIPFFFNDARNFFF